MTSVFFRDKPILRRRWMSCPEWAWPCAPRGETEAIAWGDVWGHLLVKMQINHEVPTINLNQFQHCSGLRSISGSTWQLFGCPKLGEFASRVIWAVNASEKRSDTASFNTSDSTSYSKSYEGFLKYGVPKNQWFFPWDDQEFWGFRQW
jgi:hypothetical protein